MPETPSVPFQTAPADKQQSRDSFAGGYDDFGSLAKEFLRNVQGREQTADFLVSRDRPRARTGRLRSQVKRVRAVGDQLCSEFQGGFRRCRVRAAVAEGVRREVQDAEKTRPG